MHLLLIAILFAVNFGISWFNAYSVGRSWADSKAIGGWPRFMVWCGAIMSGCGFTWCYLIIFALIAMATGKLSMNYIQLMLEVGYVAIFIPIMGSGLAIWMDSVTTAWRRRNATSIGVAAWNTFAMAHNTYEAARTMPKVLQDIGKAFSKGNGQAKLLLLVVLLVLLALCAGGLTTAAIIRSTARGYARGVIESHGFQRASPATT
jgi:hypothetical protein